MSIGHLYFRGGDPLGGGGVKYPWGEGDLVEPLAPLQRGFTFTGGLGEVPPAPIFRIFSPARRPTLQEKKSQGCGSANFSSQSNVSMGSGALITGTGSEPCRASANDMCAWVERK